MKRINKDVENCKTFIRENFLQMPTVKGVAIYSLFIKDFGTFTDPEIIKQAISEVRPDQLFKR